VTAENIANAATPGFTARDVTAFDEALAKMAGSGQNKHVVLAPDQAPWSVRPSGNSVSLEEELVRGSGIQQAYSMNVGIVSAFHRMFLTAVRG
jgi:flagellar basal-body rod protein FlgB